jgi:tRNA 2-thiouridine synthesizing protein A
LESGQVVHLVCTDSGSVKDFNVFCTQSGHHLLDAKSNDISYEYWLKKA